MKYLVLKKGWRWAAPVNARTPKRALVQYLKEPIEKWSDLPGEYTVFNDDETACWHFEYSRSTKDNDVFQELQTVEHVPRVSTPSPQVSIDINDHEYTWRPHSFTPGTEQLAGLRSGYTVGFVFPPTTPAGKFSWSAEHVPSNTTNSGKENTKDEAKAALVQWLKTQGASCKKS